MADEGIARYLAQEAISAFGRIDILVNNAEVHFVKDVTEMTIQEWDRLMDINLKSMFLCCKHVIPHMLKQNRGTIVNLASISSFVGQEMNGPAPLPITSQRPARSIFKLAGDFLNGQ